jgi:hypothetical protein
MNLHITKEQQAYWLPKALEGQQGRVDSELLHTLWQQYPKNSAKIRTLIKDLSAVTLTPKDSAIDKLAELLPDPSFLSRWLTQGKKTYPSLIAVVSSYFEVNEPNLCFDSLKRTGFLIAHKTIKDKYLVDLKKIPDVVSFISESKLDKRYLSLFIWKLIIESQIAKSKFPGEPSLQEFESAFILALKNGDLDELLADAYAADWKWQAPLCTEQGVKEEVTSTEEAPIAKPNSTPPPAVRCITGEGFLAETKAFEIKVEKYNSNYHNLFSKAKSLAGDDDPTSALRQIREYSAVLEELYVVLKNETCDLITRVNKSLDMALQKLGLIVEHRQATKFSITTSKQWLEDAAERIELHSSVFVLLEEFEDIDIVSRLNEENHTLAVSCKYEELQEKIKRLADRYQRMVKGAAAEKEFDDAIKCNLSNLEWNIFQDLTLKNDTWEKLAEYYILTENMGTRLGITVQRMFRSKNLAFGDLLSSKLPACNSSNISTCVHTLSWLTLGQQEQLAKTHPPLKTLVALSQLDAYFKALSHGLDFYIYWSTSPLGEISNSHASLTVREFFKSIYDIISAPEVEPLNSQSLALCVSSTQIGNAINQNERTSLDVFTDDLREILAYRKKGGRTTYAHIWQAAYEEIFSPLLDELNNHGVKEFINAYEKWQSDFDVDYRIDSWKSEIPEHLKKNSEYDKFIRNQVSLKTSEIDDWLDIYKSVTQKVQLRKTNPLANLKLKIDKIFNSSEQDCTLIRGWLESKTIDQKNKSNNYICQNRNWTTGINCAASFKNIDAFHPRAFAKIIDRPVTYEDIYTDDLVSSFGYGTSEHLVELYASNELFEGYALIANDSNEEISPSLDRKVEKRTEEIASELKQRMLVLEGGQSNAHLKTALINAQNRIENQQWRLAASEILKAEIIAKDISESVKVLEERARLLSKIEQLGGHIDAAPDLDNSKLTTIWNDLIHAHRGRRLHIIVLEKLLRLSSTEFETQLLDCIEYLDQLNLYPAPAASELVAYYLEQAVDPIYSELSRSRTLLATYASQLRKLGKLLVLNIRHDQNLFEEGSNLIAMLVDTAEQWQRLSSEGKPGVDKILEVFIRRGFQEPEELSGNNQVADTGHIPLNDQHVMDETETFKELVARAKEIVAAGEDKVSDTKEDIAKLIHLKAWEAVAENSLIKLKTAQFNSSEDLINWAVSSALAANIPFNTIELASVLRMINSKAVSSVVRYLHQEKSVRPLVGDLVARLIVDMASSADANNGKESGYQALDALQILQDNINSALLHQENFRRCFEVSVFDTIGLRAYWDRFAGDQKQAEARATLMYLAWRFHSTRAVAYCLTMQPIDLEKRKAEALARVAEDALVSGNSDLLQGFFDLKKSIQAKPFQIFADLVLSNSISHSENAARLTLMSGLERHIDGTLRSVLRIEPRRVDSPDSITLKLPNNCPVRFSNATATEKLNGPFFTDTSLPISFKLLDEHAVKFSVELTCSVVSLTGELSNFSQTVDFSILGDTAFEFLTPDEIDDAFDNFPDVHMRGENYVPRVIDEQKIEKALFRSKTVRSVWISSPRRSGKTTMLYRILDAFSHKVKRDNLVVYLTLDETFADSMSFNRWIWRRLRTFSPNKELRELYEDFEAIGRDLPFDSDTGTFIGELSDRLLSFREDGTRIIFLIDEIDRFAAMYFEGGPKKNAAVDILWQIRHAVTDRRDIGMVFAGSSAAKQIFITDAESPFYNSIDHLELTPFSCKNKTMEETSRQIVEPHRVRTKYNFPKDSLEHLIWVCAGIPYYMKLVAGATYARAKQSHILKADVNEGLRALLGRDTGISKLDDMGGDPGSDDLRTTISIEKSADATLAKAVLYSFADLHSPISGHKTYRGKISSSESRLVSHYNITKAQIERGLDICIGLGLIRTIETESFPEIDFVIPILGESLRKSSGRLWANIDHELVALAQGGN